jgi:hypothetical protein
MKRLRRHRQLVRSVNGMQAIGSRRLGHRVRHGYRKGVKDTMNSNIPRADNRINGD